MEDKSNVDLSFPDSREARFKSSMPRLTHIIDSLKKAYKRDYKQSMYTQEELDIRNTAIFYINRVNPHFLRQHTLEMTLVIYILPLLNIAGFNFKDNLFYVAKGISGYPLGYWIISEEELHTLYLSDSQKLNTKILMPTEEQLSAILYWHHNKIHNVKYLYPTWNPFYAYHINMLRTIPIAFCQYYWLQLAKTKTTIFDCPQSDRDKAIRTSVSRLKFSYQIDSSPPLHINMKNFIDDLCKKFDDSHFVFIRKLLWGLSHGNLPAVKSFLEMIATIYLGHDYIKTATSTHPTMNIIHCKNTQVIKQLLESIFTFSFTFDNNDYTVEPEHRPIYSLDPPVTLAANLTSSAFIDAELNGGLVNISIDKSKDDLGHLAKVAKTSFIKFKEDRIFRTVKYVPDRYYVHITESVPVDPPSNMQYIELTGNIADKEYKFEDIHAAILILLSLVNFFVPTTLPLQKPRSPHSFTSEEDVARKFIEELFDDTTSKFSPEDLENAIKKWYTENRVIESSNLDMSKAKNDTLRKIATSIGILEEPHTKAKEIEIAFELWRKHAPYTIGDIKIIDVLKKLYNPLFYFKYNNARSRIQTNTKKNVRVFFGLALDTEKLETLSDEENISEFDMKQRQEDFIQYYEDMIQNFRRLLPQVRESLLQLDTK